MEQIGTLVIGAGQAGLATSHWLAKAGAEHLVVDRRDRLGGGWNDRWDSLHLVAPNFTVMLPGMPYAGPDPDGFMPRAEVVAHLTEYATVIGAPVRLGVEVTRLAPADGGFVAHTGSGPISARTVVLATGPYQRPKIPPVSRRLPAHVRQLHSADYRRPRQLADGAVLVVGTGQSGAQIAEELHDAGREVHLAVSECSAVPRRYRGRDSHWWLTQAFLHGAEVGAPFPTVADLPSPAARFACNSHVSGKDGGHDIDLRDFARRGMRLYGRLESAGGATVRFSDDLDQRLARAETGFENKGRPLIDAYIAAAGIDAPPDDRPPASTFVPDTATELDLDAAGISTVLWATGFRLDFSWLDVPVLDEWGYPRHTRGVTEHPGLYAVGLPWLHSEPSAVFAGIAADTAHVVDRLTTR